MNKEANVFAQHEEGAKNFGCTIPLYTHPAKTLTEQDLDKLIKDAEKGGYMDLYITGLIDGFNHARAILRKAQDK